jgi:hypothetical protein
VKSFFIGGEPSKTILAAAIPPAEAGGKWKDGGNFDNSFYYPGYRKSNPLFRSRAAISARNSRGTAPYNLIAMALLNR